MEESISITYAYADKNIPECFHPPLDRETPNFIFHFHVKLTFTLFTECLRKKNIFKSIPVNFDLPDGTGILAISGLPYIFPALWSLCVFALWQGVWSCVCDSLCCAGQALWCQSVSTHTSMEALCCCTAW